MLVEIQNTNTYSLGTKKPYIESWMLHEGLQLNVGRSLD